MMYRLNLFLKNFGNNSTPSVSFFPKDETEIKNLLNGYKPVLKNYQLFKYEHEIHDNVFIEKRTELHKCDILSLLK